LKITISKENYLKTIAEAASEGELVIAATLARWLNVSAPAVTTATRRLGRDGLIRIAKDGRIALTSSGREIANRLLLRHYLIERMLAELFGMEWYRVHDEAEQMEHAVSADFERLLRDKLGEDRPCPHGNYVHLDTPEQRRKRGLIPLLEAAPSHQAIVESVFERDRQLLEFLDGLGIRPGAKLDIVARNYDDTLVLQMGRRKLPLGRSAAERIWVRPAPSPRNIRSST
jgi:DtxR family Mn-dependent transcriptional regulator